LEVTGNPEIYVGLVLGVGRGTFAVVCFCIIGVVICFFKDSQATPNLCVALGIALPLVVLIIILLLPKKSLNTDKS